MRNWTWNRKVPLSKGERSASWQVFSVTESC